MQTNNSNNNDSKDHPELMSFANRRAMFSQNLANQQNQYSNNSPNANPSSRPIPKRRQSTPCMIPPPESISRPRVASPGASLIPPPQASSQNSTAAPVATNHPPQTSAPQTASPPPTNTLSTPKMTETPKVEEKEAIPPMRSTTSSSITTPTSSSPSLKTPSDTSRGRVIWVKPDVKPANPLDSRNLTPDQILSNEEAFKIARERRRSDGAILYAQKLQLKQSSGDMPKVFIPPPPSKASPQVSNPPPVQKQEPPVQKQEPPVQKQEPPPEMPPAAKVVERSAPVAPAQAPAEPKKSSESLSTPSNNTAELPKFGSPVTNESNEKPKKDEPVQPQAFKNAFKFFASLGVTPRRLSDDVGNPSEQSEISSLQKSIDSGHRKRAFTDNH